ncbi:hypothetical protein [Streptomyces mirabilis]|uniref:hypothetical protein n=1 Tax=Streptomyces mirabilis TaxID=68239 RepID=UPI002256E47F|nr:hypothetical protein [Streptomyces mirabilis]MCX4612116.1 hypothetical protein [Streptomyces mirabilis]
MKKSNSFKNRAAAAQKAARRALLTCPRGCGRGKPGHNYCTDCGAALPAATTKAAPASGTLWDRYRNSADPAEREFAWKQTYGPMIRKFGGDPR